MSTQIAEHKTQSIKETLVKVGTPRKGLARFAGRIASIAERRNLTVTDTQELVVFIADRKPQLATVDKYLEQGYYVSRIAQAYEIREIFRNNSSMGLSLSLSVILELLDYFGDAEDTEYFAEEMTLVGVKDGDFWQALKYARSRGLCYLGDLI